MSVDKEFFAIYDKGNKTYFCGEDTAYDFTPDFTNALRFGTQVEADEFIMDNYVPVDRFEVRKLLVRYEVQKIQQVDRVSQILSKLSRSELETLAALGIMKIDVDQIMCHGEPERDVMLFGTTQLNLGAFNDLLAEVVMLGTPGIKNLSFLSINDKKLAEDLIPVEIHYVGRILSFMKNDVEIFRKVIPQNGVTKEFTRSVLNTLFYTWLDNETFV